MVAGLTRGEVVRLLGGGLAVAMLPGSVRAAAKAAGAKPYDFWFTRLKYDAGDWDVDARMPSNLITSLIDYTNLRVDPKERVVPLADPAMLAAPLVYLAGHKLVEFSAPERRNFERYVRNGGFVLVDDCNHDIDGLFAKSFERQMAAIFGAAALKRLPPDHPVFRAFLQVRRPAEHRLRAQRLGATTSSTTISGASRSMAGSA